LVECITKQNNSLERWKPQLDVILTHGTLAHRIVKSIGEGQSLESVIQTYKDLSACLAENKMFLA
ncbi:MAG: hypothetical protein C0490_16815, partial [Marivirga sp.]|nr:hypothetical protein [Marivirga sp.]